MTKTIFNYDPLSGVFSGSDSARESPLESGVFLLPAFATDLAPPDCSDSERPVFKNGNWIVEALPVPEPEPKPTVAEIWGKIKSERDRRKVGGVKVKVGTFDKWFHSDDASRIQQMALVMMGANIPANLQWKTLDDSFVTMTQAVAQSVFAAAAASDQAIFAVAEGHRVAMEASADPAVYDYSTGWPAIFGE